MNLQIKRVYDKPVKSDGYRVLVDRLWPRGMSKEKAALDAWHKEIAPSPELRKWFDHDPERFDEFAARYEDELSGSSAVDRLKKEIKGQNPVTLLYAAHDPKINHAVVLQKILQQNN